MAPVPNSKTVMRDYLQATLDIGQPLTLDSAVSIQRIGNMMLSITMARWRQDHGGQVLSGRRLIEIERAPLVSGLRFSNAISGRMAGLGFCDEESSSAMMMVEPKLRANSLQFTAFVLERLQESEVHIIVWKRKHLKHLVCKFAVTKIPLSTHQQK